MWHPAAVVVVVVFGQKWQFSALDYYGYHCHKCTWSNEMNVDLHWRIRFVQNGNSHRSGHSSTPHGHNTYVAVVVDMGTYSNTIIVIHQCRRVDCWCSNLFQSRGSSACSSAQPTDGDMDMYSYTILVMDTHRKSPDLVNRDTRLLRVTFVAPRCICSSRFLCFDPIKRVVVPDTQDQPRIVRAYTVQQQYITAQPICVHQIKAHIHGSNWKLFLSYIETKWIVCQLAQLSIEQDCSLGKVSFFSCYWGHGAYSLSVRRKGWVDRWSKSTANRGL